MNTYALLFCFALNFAFSLNLPPGYDADDDTGITDLSTTVLLEWLHDIEPSENSFKGSVTVFLFWRDERLANLTTKATDLSATRVWQPSVKLYNLDGNTIELAPKSVRLLPSGEMRATQSFTIESYCIVSSQFYPMDQNNCRIFLQFMGNSVKLTSGKLILNKGIINSMHNKWWVHSPESELVPAVAFGAKNVKFVGKTDIWCEFSFSAARLHDHEMKNIVFPLFLVAFFAAVSVMIPGKDVYIAISCSRIVLSEATYGERLGVVVTIQLALIVLLSVIEQRVAPSGTGKPPILFGFFVYSTILCLWSFLEALWYLYYSDGNGVVSLPCYVKPIYQLVYPCPIETDKMCDTGVKRMHCVTGGILIGITAIYVIVLTSILYAEKADDSLKNFSSSPLEESSNNTVL